MADSIRIVLADDHAVLRTGLRVLLEAEPDMVVVGEAGDGNAAVQQVKELKPDVIVMDLSMPGLGGLDATRRITSSDLDTKVLVLTVYAEEEYLLPVIEAGGHGYVPKTSADRDLVNAIRCVARGEVFLYPHAAKLLLLRYKAARSSDAHDPMHSLTQREREVLTLTAEGYSSSEIGGQLFISPKTVDTYRSRIMQKLKLSHRSELVRFALQAGLLKPQ